MKNSRSLLPTPQTDSQARAVDVLRQRQRGRQLNYTQEEIQKAVELVSGWEPNHAFLRFRERKDVI